MSPPAAKRRRGRRTQAERSAATQERILRAAVETLVERGYHRTSTAAICRRARVTRGAQLHHWPTKAGLLAAAVEHLFQRRHDELRALLADGRAPSLEAVFGKLWEIYSGPTLAAWLELVVAARTDRSLRQAVQGVDRRLLPEAEATLRRLFAGAPAELTTAATRLVLSLLDGLALHHQVEGERAQVGPVLELFQGLIGPWLGGER